MHCPVRSPRSWPQSRHARPPARTRTAAAGRGRAARPRRMYDSRRQSRPRPRRPGAGTRSQLISPDGSTRPSDDRLQSVRHLHGRPHHLHLQGGRPRTISDHQVRPDTTANDFTTDRALFRAKGDQVGKILGLGDEAYYVVPPTAEDGSFGVAPPRRPQDVLVTGATGTLTQFEILARRGAVRLDHRASTSTSASTTSTSSTSSTSRPARPPHQLRLQPGISSTTRTGFREPDRPPTSGPTGSEYPDSGPSISGPQPGWPTTQSHPKPPEKESRGLAPPGSSVRCVLRFSPRPGPPPAG